MNRSHIKYISGLLLFGLNGIVSAKIDLSSHEIVFFRTLFGGMFLFLLYLWINRTPKKSISETPDSILNTSMHMSTSDSSDIDNNKNLRKEYLYILLSGISMGLSWILFLSFINTGVGCYLYFSETAKLPVTTVSILGYLEPLSAVFFFMQLCNL